MPEQFASETKKSRRNSESQGRTLQRRLLSYPARLVEWGEPRQVYLREPCASRHPWATRIRRRTRLTNAPSIPPMIGEGSPRNVCHEARDCEGRPVTPRVNAPERYEASFRSL